MICASRARTRILLVIAGAIALAAAHTQAQAQPRDKIRDPWDRDKPVVGCLRSFERGQVAQKSGALVLANELYEECVRVECPSAVRMDCGQRLELVDKATPTVSLVIRDAATRDLAVPIKIDGKPFVTTPGRAAPVDPGEHVVTWSVGGGKIARANFTAHEGEKSRVIMLSPTSVTTDPDAAAAPSTTTTGTSTDDPGAAAAPPKKSSGPYILAGVAGGSAFMSLLFFVAVVGNLRETAKLDHEIAAEGGVSTPNPSPRLFELVEERNDNVKTLNVLAAVAATSALIAGGALAGSLVWQAKEKKARQRATTAFDATVLTVSF